MSHRRLALVTVWLAACASSHVGGSDPDAVGTSDDSAAETDGAAADSSPLDTASIDGPTAIDGATTIDVPGAIDAPIDANTCPTQPCDLHAQCGCTSPLVCDLDFTDLVGTQCRAVNQAGTEGASCTNASGAQFSYCAGGYVCVGGATDAVCERYCNTSADCSAPRGQCVIQLVNGTTPIPGATTCSSNCSPVNSAGGGCPAGQKCGFFTVNNALTGNTDRDIVDCTLPGAGGLNATCTDDSMCGANLLCSTVSAATRCRRVCNRTTGGSECAGIAGTTCLGFNPALTIGGTEYGICG